MVINAIRMRGKGQDDWQAFKLSLGTGRFRNYQCLTAAPPTLKRLAAALDFALTGRETTAVYEVAVQLGDDAGHTWLVHRRPGQTRFLRDGVALGEAEGARAFVGALMDKDQIGDDADGPAVAEIGRFEVRGLDEGVARVALGTGDTPQQAVKEVARRQLQQIAAEGARLLGVPALAEPRVVAKLARMAQPLHAQYRELCRQYAELKQEETAFSDQDLASMHTLAAELELMKHLDETAAPLLAPGVSLKALKEELAKTDAQIAELSAAIGIDAPQGEVLARDFRKPLEALSRLEAHAKLVRASQAARKYCEQNLEPRFKRYVESAAGGLAGDRQIAADLESCLVALSMRLGTPAAQAAQAATPATTPGTIGVKTWFDRFKIRQAEAQAQAPGEDAGNVGEARALAELETARTAIEYALSRITELGAGVQAARQRHDSALGALDEAHEELVRNFARHREQWVAVARETGLPDDLDLGRLVKLVVSYGRLTLLVAQREELAQRVRKYLGRVAKAERLLVEWRQATGSQKLADLSNPSILLAEARDVLRYHEVKRKRFDQLTAAAAEAKGMLAVRGMLKGRRKALMTAWREVFSECGVPELEIHEQKLDELFKRAGLVEALALVHGSQSATPEKLFEAGVPETALSLYLWEDEAVDGRHRLAFLQQLEDAMSGELRLLLLADEGLAAMLTPLGIGAGSVLLAKAPVKAEAPAPAPAPKPVAVDAASRATLRPANSAAARSTTKASSDSAALLNERARRTLELLAVKKP